MEEREIFVLSTSNTQILFQGVQQIAVMRRYREDLSTNKISNELVYLITNLSESELSAQELLELKRSYWGIENKLHYRKDFVFGEDRSTIRAKHGPQNMSAIRNFAVSIYNASGIANIKRFVDNIKYDNVSFLKLAFGF